MRLAEQVPLASPLVSPGTRLGSPATISPSPFQRHRQLAIQSACHGGRRGSLLACGPKAAHATVEMTPPGNGKPAVGAALLWTASLLSDLLATCSHRNRRADLAKD